MSATMRPLYMAAVFSMSTALSLSALLYPATSLAAPPSTSVSVPAHKPDIDKTDTRKTDEKTSTASKLTSKNDIAASPDKAVDAKTSEKEIADKTAEAKPEKKSVTKGSYEKSYVGNMQIYTAAYEDTLIDIARRNNLGFVEMRSANPFIDPWIPGAGTKITIPSRHILPDAKKEGVVINLPEMRIYYFPKDGSAPITHPIGVGRVGLETPTGSTKVLRKTIGPTWRPTARMRKEDPNLPEAIKAGSSNPLGTHAMYLGWPSYAIHGTNKPFGIGRRVSSGCIRLYPEDIVTLFDEVQVSDPVTVVNQPIKAGWIDDILYIEVHADLDQSNAIEESGGFPTYDVKKEDLALIRNLIKEENVNVDWFQIREAIRRRQGYPIPIAVKHSEDKKSDI